MSVVPCYILKLTKPKCTCLQKFLYEHVCVLQTSKSIYIFLLAEALILAPFLGASPCLYINMYTCVHPYKNLPSITTHLGGTGLSGVQCVHTVDSKLVN